MKPFSVIAGLVFGLIALVQLVRVVMGWPVVINGYSVPLWPSVVACVVTGLLSIMVLRETRR